MYISVIVNICDEFNNKNNCEVLRAQRGGGSIVEIAKPARLHYLRYTRAKTHALSFDEEHAK